MKSNQVTIKDLARHLNVSVATVSRALRDLPDIHPDTKRAVVELAAAWDYQPNQLATSLVKNRTRTIGVIVPNLGYYFFSTAIRGIEEAAHRAGYSVLLTQSNESYQRELTNIQDLARGQVEGLIVSLSQETSQYEHFHRLVRRGLPLVLFDRETPELHVSKVVIDNRQAAAQATRHLIENRCRRIAILAGPDYLALTHQRLAGYQDALRESGMGCDPALVAYGDYSQGVAIDLTHRMMTLPEPPDGLVAVSDRLAVGALIALRKHGTRIPEDMAIVSFNNEPVSELLSPPLSSVAQPILEMSRTATELLIRQIESEVPLPPETRVFPTQLVVRASSVRPATVTG
jgi:DNA-binding LacI/PurR family transcriptional regulator